jgi:hypothetical protein
VADPVTELAAFFARNTTVPRCGSDPVDQRRAGRRAPLGGHRYGVRHRHSKRHLRGDHSARRGQRDYTGRVVIPGHPARGGETHWQPPLPAADLAVPRLRAAGDRSFPAGRPARTEHGHAPDCARLARDQAGDLADRRAWVPRLIDHSEPARGPRQRHQPSAPSSMTAPAAVGTGSFTPAWRLSTEAGAPQYATTATPTWPLASPSRWPSSPPAWPASASLDCDPPAHSQRPPLPRHRDQITWRLNWEHTTLLTEDARGECTYDIVKISRDRTESIMADLAHYWPLEAAHLP